jgi:ketosteroid isomerase-like protein
MAAPRDADVVRRIFEAFERRDVEAALELCAADVEFWLPATARLAAVEGPYRGHDGVRRYFDDVERVWGALEVGPQEFLLIGDCVVVSGSVATRRSLTMYSSAGWLLKVRRGKIVYCEVHPSVDEAIAAAKLTA